MVLLERDGSDSGLCLQFTRHVVLYYGVLYQFLVFVILKYTDIDSINNNKNNNNNIVVE